MPLNFVAIGALGHMLSPSVRFLQSDCIRIHKYLDRQTDTPLKQQRRLAWQAYGAIAVSNIEALCSEAIDGVIICAGKNGDDLELIRKLLILMRPKHQSAMIIHCSTVSPMFVRHAHTAAQQAGHDYVNWPLTGGPKGAETAQMLILTSGPAWLFEKNQAWLKQIGQPKYFTDDLILAPRIKLLGHTLVFSNLMGCCVASQVYQTLGMPPIPSQKASDFFDFLNQGAGGSKQWEVALKIGVQQNNWQDGFLLAHAVIDAFYTVQMLIEASVSNIHIIPILHTLAALCWLVENHGLSWATQQLARALWQTKSSELDAWLKQHLDYHAPAASITHLASRLPISIQKSMYLQCQAKDFQAH